MGNCTGKQKGLKNKGKFKISPPPLDYEHVDGDERINSLSSVTGHYSEEGKLICHPSREPVAVFKDQIRIGDTISPDELFPSSEQEQLVSVIPSTYNGQREIISSIDIVDTNIGSGQNNLYVHKDDWKHLRNSIEDQRDLGEPVSSENNYDNCLRHHMFKSSERANNRLVSSINIKDSLLENRNVSVPLLPKFEELLRGSSEPKLKNTDSGCVDVLLQDHPSASDCEEYSDNDNEQTDVKHISDNSYFLTDNKDESCSTIKDHKDGSYVSVTVHATPIPPKEVQMWLNEFHKDRIFSVIQTKDEGGRYNLDGTYMWMPSKCIHGPNQKLLLVKSKNVLDWPTTCDKADVISDVYHFLPHGQRFRKRIMLKFKLNTDSQYDKNIQLLYSKTDHNAIPIWNIVDNSSKDTNNNPVWFCLNGYCYLFLRHFCCFCLVKRGTLVRTQRSLSVEKHLNFLVTMYGLFKPETNVVQITGTFQIDKTTPPLPEMNLGVPLDQDVVSFDEQISGYSCQLELVGSGLNLKEITREWKQPLYKNLSHICQLPICPMAKFHVVLDSPSLQQGCGFRMTVNQNDNDIVTLFDLSSTFQQLVQNEINNEMVTTDNIHQPFGIKEQQIPNVSTDALLPDISQGISEQHNTRGHSTRQCVRPKNSRWDRRDASPNFDGEDFQSDSRLTKLQNHKKEELPIESIIPYLKELIEPEREHLPTEVEQQVCSLLDKDGVWQDLGSPTLGNKLTKDNVVSSPSKFLLDLWIFENGDNWGELVGKLQGMGDKGNQAADIITNWVTETRDRSSNEGESNGSETQLKVI